MTESVNVFGQPLVPWILNTTTSFQQPEILLSMLLSIDGESTDFLLFNPNVYGQLDHTQLKDRYIARLTFFLLFGEKNTFSNMLNKSHYV